MNFHLITNNVFNPASGAWIWDPGSSEHITGDRTLIRNTFHSDASVQVNTGNVAHTACQGNALLHCDVDGDLQEIGLLNVHYVPGFRGNIVSHSKLKAKGVIMVEELYKKGARLVYEGNTMAYLDDYHGIYVFRNYHVTNNVMFANLSKADFHIWHRRLAYQNHRYVKETAKVVEGMEITKGKDNKPHACEACVSGKQERELNKFFTESASELGDLIVTNLNGVSSILATTKEGAHYMMSLTDYATKHSWVRLLKFKDEVSQKLIEFDAIFYRQTGIKIKAYRMDNGTEYFKGISKFKKKGVKFKLT